MAAIHDLLNQIADSRLRDRLAAEWAKATQNKKFGLVFEGHLPELLPLPKARPRRGDLVCKKNGHIQDLWQVRRVADGLATCARPRNELPANTDADVSAQILTIAVEELLVVRQFGDPIFPSLVPSSLPSSAPIYWASNPCKVSKVSTYPTVQISGASSLRTKSRRRENEFRNTARPTARILCRS